MHRSDSSMNSGARRGGIHARRLTARKQGAITERTRSREYALEAEETELTSK